MELTRDDVLTPDDLMEIGREFAESYWDQLSPEELVAKIDVGRFMSVVPPEQRMAGLPLEERLAGVPQDEIEEFLKSHRQKYRD